MMRSECISEPSTPKVLSLFFQLYSTEAFGLPVSARSL
jgi:hypothetical protein